jgi:hypothetical protein
MVKRWVAAD